MKTKKNDVVIVGAGPAGIGVASLLAQTQIDYVILDKKVIGTSFYQWPENMEMITPSFPSNAFGQMDLNSICEATSPAFSFSKEHLTGQEYAEYLTVVSLYHQLNVEINTEVTCVYESKEKEGWILDTNQGKFECKYLIWAAGEFGNPKISNIEGAENCIHSSVIRNPSTLEGDEFIVIGGYESGVQLAAELIEQNKKIALINPSDIHETETSDPSKALSPYTSIKYEKIKTSSNYTEIINEVRSINKVDESYIIELRDKTKIKSLQKPICATGFNLVQKPIEQLITPRADGLPLLNIESDEFYNQDNIYLAGPSVRHDDHIFCFIYKFRQRFGVIVEDIMNKEGYEINQIVEFVNKWRKYGFYLSDLSCCDQECIC